MVNRAHLPAWLEYNRLFRFIFLIRKLFLTKARFIHYSQFAEDISIRRFFPKSYQGFFVDVGCFHPKKYNNTWLLYKRGWCGINIDIDPIKIAGFKLLRPADTNIATAISDIEGEVSLYSRGFYSLTSSLSEKFSEGKTGYRTKKTTSKKLTTVLDESKYKDHEIDFLSVDAEGHDLEVLQSLDFKRYKPKLVAVESHFPLFSDVQESALYKFLVKKDYCLVGWSGLTLLMANKELQTRLQKI